MHQIAKRLERMASLQRAQDINLKFETTFANHYHSEKRFS